MTDNELLQEMIDELKIRNELETQKLELQKIATETNVAFVKTLSGYLGPLTDNDIQEAVSNKIINIENKVDNFIIGSNVDIIKNLVPVEWKVDTNYERDMIVSYEGNIYKVIQKHTSQANWTPDDYPAGFVLIATQEDLENVEDGGCPQFVQPTGGHDAYNINDCVVFEGKSYASLINNNVWSPTANPSGWKLV